MRGGRRRARILLATVLPMLALGSCAYFNALYNANRLFSEAEQAARRGEEGRARQAYEQSLEKAARSLRKDPDGRWADDALYLIGRAHFAKEENAEAAAALQRALAITHDDGLRAGAQTYLGAAMLRLGEADSARAELDRALGGHPSEDVAALAHLWRGRTLFELGRDSLAWEDLGAAMAQGGDTGFRAAVEATGRAIALGSDDRAAAALREVAAERQVPSWAADTVRTLTDSARARWGPASAERLLEPFESSAWSTEDRNALALMRMDYAAAAGDTAAARDAAHRLAEGTTGTAADAARVRLARWTLAGASEAEDLVPAREVLLPALRSSDARKIIQNIKTLEVLLQEAGRGEQPLALYAAAELARDQLGAPVLARRLFLAHAQVAGTSPYAGRSLLAAFALSRTDAERAEVKALLDRARDNIYVAATRGPVPDSVYARAESRLGPLLEALNSDAAKVAAGRDNVVTQRIAAIDSIKEAARADSLRLACGLMVDSAGITGEHADSTRAACVRGDSARVDSLLQGRLRLYADSTAAQQDSVGGPPGAGADTLFPPVQRDTSPAGLALIRGPG